MNPQTADEQEARWRWVLAETVRRSVPPTWRRRARRHEDPKTFSEIVEHCAWLGTVGAVSPELAGEPEKAMRWACWAQGALCAHAFLSLNACKYLNQRTTWEAHRARAPE